MKRKTRNQQIKNRGFMLCFDHVVIQMIIFYVLLEAVISGIRNLRRNIEFIKRSFHVF